MHPDKVFHHRRRRKNKPGLENERLEKQTACLSPALSPIAWRRRAVEEYKTALRYDPLHADTMCNLGSALQDLGNYPLSRYVPRLARWRPCSAEPQIIVAPCSLFLGCLSRNHAPRFAAEGAGKQATYKSKHLGGKPKAPESRATGFPRLWFGRTRRFTPRLEAARGKQDGNR